LALDTRLISSIAILISFLLAVPLSSLLNPFVLGGKHLNIVLVVASSLLLIGLVHDLFSMLPTWHIGALVSGGVVIWSIGDGIALQEQLPTAATLVLTVLWFVIVPTAFKQLDASERLAAGIAIIIGVGLFALAMMNLQPRLATCAIGLVGSNLGLLVQPRYSARPHLGAGGALLDGFVIAYIALMLYPQQVSTSVSFALVSALIPLLLCLVPLITIVTTLFSTMLRVFGNNHISPSSIHSLLSAVTLRENISTALIFVGVSATSLIAIILGRIDSTVGLPIGLLTVLSYIMVAIFLLHHSLRHRVAGRPQIRIDTS
jgi:UDP-N-acetylmuramyl pentapeptide phosphotransferase/UDP-N-acetylglucosamine-1-phosphate transferase